MGLTLSPSPCAGGVDFSHWTKPSGMSSRWLTPGRAHTNLPAPTLLWQYSYVQLGCSKRAEQMMLSYAKTLVGKPFSNAGMARSILFPRQSTGDSFFCAGMSPLRRTPHRVSLYTLRSPVRRTRCGRAQEGRTHVRSHPHAPFHAHAYTHSILFHRFAGLELATLAPRPPRASTACTRTRLPLRPTHTRCVSLQTMERPQGRPRRRAFDSWVLDPSTPRCTRVGTRPPLPPAAGTRRAREATPLLAQASAVSAGMDTLAAT